MEADRLSATEYGWALQHAWSDAAGSARRITDRARSVSLWLLVAAAAVAALVPTVSDQGLSRALGIGAALGLGIGGAIQSLYATPARAREWTAARHASESLKSAVLTALVGAPPYDIDEREREDLIYDTIADIEQRASTHATRAATVEPRALPAITDARSYCELRTEDQRAWHARKSIIHRRRGDQLRHLVLAFTVAGAVLAAIGAWADSNTGAWIAAVASGTAALTAHSNSSQDDSVAAAYAATASRLEFEIERFRADPDSARAGERLVRETERILAIQNENWADLIHQQAA